MHKFILSKGKVILIIAIAFVISIAQIGWVGIQEGRATVRDATCAVTGPRADGSYYVVLDVICDGRTYRLNDAKVVVSYLKHPGSLDCRVSSLGLHSCKER